MSALMDKLERALLDCDDACRRSGHSVPEDHRLALLRFGVPDCVDNSGKPYQSQDLYDMISVLRTSRGRPKPNILKNSG